MRIRLCLLATLLVTALILPMGARARPAGGDPTYVDPVAASTYCKALPKHKVRGMRRVTPFRVCVNGLRAMKRHRRLSATRACGSETRRNVLRVRGKRRSPYGLCVAAGRQLRRDGF